MKKLANITAAVLVSSLVLAGCGDDGDKDDSKSSDDAASQTTDANDDTDDDASEDSSDDASDDASDEGDDGDDAGEDTDFGAPADGATIKGNGYSYSIPKDWKDVTANAKKMQGTVDTAAIVAKPTGTFGDNVNVGVNNSPGQTLDGLESSVPGELKAIVPKLERLPRVTIDGEEAIHHRGDASAQGANYFLEQFVTVHDDDVVIVTFSFDKDTKPGQRDKVVNSILASFDFED